MNNQDLLNKILQASNIINNASRNSSANYMIVSPEIAKAIQDLDKYEKRKRIIEKLLKSDS